ncbi:hypothetical protein [Algirhabdus cladophorae]|uniref:hypothetical protein n=1 Tax=Algirhabdus cladophorae TaxID=3377108 RepID=UPI003B84685B
MRYGIFLTSVLAVLASCAQIEPQAQAPEVKPETAEAVRPKSRPNGLNTQVTAPPSTARTVDQFDTTSSAEKAQAVEVAAQDAGGSATLGRTVASLGSPADPGFWLETPLVDDVQMGRVVYLANGQAVAVELRPIEGPKTAGSRLSLPAMRVIEAPLTGLPELEVFTEN